MEFLREKQGAETVAVFFLVRFAVDAGADDVFVRLSAPPGVPARAEIVSVPVMVGRKPFDKSVEELGVAVQFPTLVVCHHGYKPACFFYDLILSHHHFLCEEFVPFVLDKTGDRLFFVHHQKRENHAFLILVPELGFQFGFNVSGKFVDVDVFERYFLFPQIGNGPAAETAGGQGVYGDGMPGIFPFFLNIGYFFM
jgi:hypothetical protein